MRARTGVQLGLQNRRSGGSNPSARAMRTLSKPVVHIPLLCVATAAFVLGLWLVGHEWVTDLESELSQQLESEQ